MVAWVWIPKKAGCEIRKVRMPAPHLMVVTPAAGCHATGRLANATATLSGVFRC